MLISRSFFLFSFMAALSYHSINITDTFFLCFLLSRVGKPMENLAYILFLYSLRGRSGIYTFKGLKKKQRRIWTQTVCGIKSLNYILSGSLEKKFANSCSIELFLFSKSSSNLLFCWYCFAIVLVSIFHVTDFLWISEGSMHLFKSKALKNWLAVLCTWVGVTGIASLAVPEVEKYINYSLISPESKPGCGRGLTTFLYYLATNL